jgi:hypothetical protein
MTAFSSTTSHESSGSGDTASAVFHHLRIRCHRNGGRLSLADLDAAERAFRQGLPLDDGEAAGTRACPEQLPFDAGALLAMLLYAHTADLAATAFASRRHATDRTWVKQFFRALADFLVDHYDPAFPARAAAAYAEAAHVHRRPISGVMLMSGAAGRAAARFCLAPLVEGPPMPPAVMAGLCTRLNTAFRTGTASSPPLQVSLAEVERWFTLVRQTPRLRAWLDDAQLAPAAEPGCGDSVNIEDLPGLLAPSPSAAR